jgi:hypothetical protein
MGTLYTDTATYSANIVIPDDGNPRSDFNAPIEALANRTHYLKDLLENTSMRLVCLDQAAVGTTDGGVQLTVTSNVSTWSIMALTAPEFSGALSGDIIVVDAAFPISFASDNNSTGKFRLALLQGGNSTEITGAIACVNSDAMACVVSLHGSYTLTEDGPIFSFLEYQYIDSGDTMYIALPISSRLQVFRP